MPDAPQPADESESTADLSTLDEAATGAAAEVERRALVEKAFKEMERSEVESLERKLFAVARTLGMDGRFAEDVPHDAMLLVLEHKAKWDPRKGNLLPYLRRVVTLLVRNYHTRGPAKHEVAADADRDEEVPRSDPNPEQAKSALDERDESNDRFAEVLAIVAKEPNVVGYIRATQKGIDDIGQQAALLGISKKEVYAASKRLKAVLRRVYERHPDAPRLPKLAARGVHAKREGGSSEGDES